MDLKAPFFQFICPLPDLFPLCFFEHYRLLDALLSIDDNLSGIFCYPIFKDNGNNVDNYSYDEMGGAEGNNDWKTRTAGFRLDLNPSESDQWSFEGGFHNNFLGQHYKYPSLDSPVFQAELKENLNLSGGNVMGRWTRQLSPTSETSLQFFGSAFCEVERSVYGKLTWMF